MNQLYSRCNECLIQSCCYKVCDKFVNKVNKKYNINLGLSGVAISRKRATTIVNQILKCEKKNTTIKLQHVTDVGFGYSYKLGIDHETTI